jgi:thiol-disulfide isomerase/thioredoxin
VVLVGWAVLNGSGGRTGGTSNGGGTKIGVTLVAYQGDALLGGNRVDLGAVIGHGKPVVLNFFAGLCPPCRAEMPGFERVYQRHAGQFLLVGADIGPFVGLGSHDDAKRLLAELGITYPAGNVENNPVEQVGIAGMPTTIVYDATGHEATRHTGLVTEGQLEQEVSALVGSTP